MSDLAEFLLARIAERAAKAQAVIDAHPMNDWDSYVSSAGMYEEAAHDFAMFNNPARLLAECEAKRRIVESEMSPYPAYCTPATRTLRYLATVYADHPDYRPEWRP